MVCRVVDPGDGHDIEVPADGRSEPGELWCQGPNVMVGYLGDDAATAETLDDDGFLHTGDIVTVDARGAFYVVDRLKELIKYHGYQVPPAELEALLLTHPAVQDAAVIGVADADGQETPKAFVVPRGAAGRRRPHGVGGRTRGPAQEDPAGCVRRCHPEVDVGQDLAQGPAGSRLTDVTRLGACRSRNR